MRYSDSHYSNSICLLFAGLWALVMENVIDVHMSASAFCFVMGAWALFFWAVTRALGK